MDKLKPVLAQKFWILCALALVLPPSGWFLGARQLVNDSVNRKGQLETTFGKAKLSGAVPNQSWADAVKKRTAAQDAYFRAAAARLWNTQKRLMVWPRTVASLMSKADYRKPPKNENDRLTAANNFRSAYYVYLKDIWKIVDPVSYPRPAGRSLSRSHIGKVVLEWETIPKIAEGTWQELPPTAAEMWDAQEDVWLVTAILRSIADVNRDATNIADASIRQIDMLRLMGGNRNTGTSGAAGGDIAAGGAMGAEAATGDVTGGAPTFGQNRGLLAGGGGAEGRQLSGRTGANLQVDFPPEDEFGSAAGAPAAVSDASGGTDVGAPVDAGAAGMGAMGMGAMGMGPSSAKERRYIDDDPDLPFRTRGFYLKVLIDHRRLPELVAALTNAHFPIEIVRIHQQDHVSDMEYLAKSTSRTARRRDDSGVEDTAGSGFARRAGQRSGAGAPGLDAEAQQTIKKALADPELSWVVLQGLMTLYLPPKFEQQAASGGDSPATGTPSPTGTPPAKNPSKPKTAAADTFPDHPPLPPVSGSTAGTKSDRKKSKSGPPVPDRPPVPGGNINPGKKKEPAVEEPPKPGGSGSPGKAGETKSGQPGRSASKSKSGRTSSSRVGTTPK